MTDSGRHGRAFGQVTQRVWIAYGALLLAIALVSATSAWLKQSDEMQALWPLLVDELTSVFVVFALTPAIVVLNGYLRPSRMDWPKVIAGHFAGLIAFSILHVTSMYLLRLAIYPLFGAWYYGDGDLWLTVIYEGRKDALVFVCIAISIAPIHRLSIHQQSIAARKIEKRAPMRIAHRNGSVNCWIAAEEVLWVEAAGNYVEIVLASRRVLQRQSLRAIEVKLADAGFVRIHRCRIVNPRHIRSLVKKGNGDFTLLLSNDSEIAGSRRFRQSLSDHFDEPEKHPSWSSAHDMPTASST